MKRLSFYAIILTAAAPPGDFKAKQETKIYSFEFSWPKEVVAISKLNRRFNREMTSLRRELIEDASSAYKEAEKSEDAFPDVGYEISWGWETAGQSRRLLSLEGGSYSYTGGAHGLPTSMSLLWDRAKNREVTIPQLLERASEYAVLAPRYCHALNRERIKKRGGGGKLRTIEEFDQCPAFSDLTVSVADKNHNGRFDSIRFTADPYVAGPYAEGAYIIELPVTARLIGAMKPEYRHSFESQPH